jgi:TetR/AcrR family transcriptional repressor of nem operon
MVEIASRMFRESGFDRVGAHAMMKGAGLTQGHVYRHSASSRANGCDCVALGAERARQGNGLRRDLAAHLRTRPEHFTRLLQSGTPTWRRKRAIAALSGMVGALTLARAVDDPGLSKESLAVARDACGAARHTDGPQAIHLADGVPSGSKPIHSASSASAMP